MDNFRRRFSTLKGRMSFTDTDQDSPPSQIKTRIQQSSARKRDTSNISSNTMKSRISNESNITPETLNLRSNMSNTSMQNKIVNPMHDDEEPMPSVEEVERLFEQVLDEMAIPKANQQKLREQDAKKKWKLIKAHNNYAPASKSTMNNRTAPEFWVNTLKDRDSQGKPTLSQTDALAMQSVFRTSHREFLLDFLEMEGVNALNQLTDHYTNLELRTKAESEILSAIVESYRLLMNNEIGMEGVLLIPGSLTSIAMAMDYVNGNDALTEKVVLLLSVACWWSEKGRQKVMDAMKYVKSRRRELSKFQTIVFLFEYTSDLSFKASIATFVTTVCNTPPTIEQRVKVRNEFLSLDIIKVFDRVLSKVSTKLADPTTLSQPDGENINSLQTQYEVFITMMRQDQKEVVAKMIRSSDEDPSHFDLSNLNESWRVLSRNAHRSDCQDNLLNLLQALFLVPVEHTLAQPIYDAIIRFVFEATSLDKITAKNSDISTQLNFDSLGKLFFSKLQYDAKVQNFSVKNSVLKRQQTLIKLLMNRLKDVSSGKVSVEKAGDLSDVLAQNFKDFSTNDNLNSTGNNNNGNNSSSKGTTTTAGGNNPGSKIDLVMLSGLGLGETANEIEIMKEREKQLLSRIDALEKQVLQNGNGNNKGGGNSSEQGNNNGGTGSSENSNEDLIKNFKGKLDSTKLVPAGICPNRTKKDPAAVPGPNMPGSLENAPIKVSPKQQNSTKADSENKGSDNKQMSLEMLMKSKQNANMTNKKSAEEKNKEILMKLGLPDKKPIKPNCKMTHVFWTVIPPENLENTIWVELSDQNVQFSPNELESLFGKKNEAKNDTLTKKNTKKSDSEKNESIKLIDSQRRQNIAIALKKIKLKNSAIKSAIISIDENILSPQIVQVLLDTCPTLDEINLISKFIKDGGDNKALAYEERYLFEVSQISNLNNRLLCIKTKNTFAYDARRILNIIQITKNAIKEVDNNADLKLILEVILAVGNYLNGGTVRGQAWGYKIDILGKLITIKDSINNGTLMHYLYVLFERNYKQLLNFELPNSAKAVSVSLKDLTNEMNNLAKNIQLIKSELKDFTSENKKDNFKQVMSPFEIKASKDVNRLQSELEKAKTDFYTLSLKFSETTTNNNSVSVEPKDFFSKLCEFEQSLKRAGFQITEMRLEAEKRKNAEEKKIERQTYMKLKALVKATKESSSENSSDKEVEGLINAFKKAHSGKTSQVVDRFLEKYKQEQEKQRKLNKIKNPGQQQQQQQPQKFLDE